MKKILILFIAVFCINTVSKAAPGDTTWVQANNVYLTYYNNYDTAVAFPAAGTSYRKILMIFTLGKYVCPGYTYGTGSVPWCGDWDYTIQNFLMTPGGDTLELGRLITPYANAGAPRTPVALASGLWALAASTTSITSLLWPQKRHLPELTARN